MDNLKQIVSQLLASGKGILAADESSKTIQKRFEKIGLTSTPETNLAYRKLFFTTPGIEEYLSGVILYDETIKQLIDLPAGRQVSVPDYLESKGILPGIKVDLGAVDSPNFPNEKVTNGLDDLEWRLELYKKMGAKFTKWRAVIKIGAGIPTQSALDENGLTLAEYAKIVQKLGMVPIIEPEVLRDGSHDLEICKKVTIQTLKTVFQKMKEQEVFLGGLLLKPNMVTCGEDNLTQATPQQVAEATIEAFKESVPSEVPGIVFLSGGQSPDMATDNLAAIVKIGGPWQFGFSFARALQGEALEIWAGKEENVESAQKAFLERAKKVSSAII